MTTLRRCQAVVGENALVEFDDQLLQVNNVYCSQTYGDVAQKLLAAFPVTNLALDVRAFVNAPSCATDFGKQFLESANPLESLPKPATKAGKGNAGFFLQKELHLGACIRTHQAPLCEERHKGGKRSSRCAYRIPPSERAFPDNALVVSAEPQPTASAGVV